MKLEQEASGCSVKVFALGHSAIARRNRHNLYPRKRNIKIQNIPFICSDDEAMKLFSFPPETENIDEIDQRKENFEGVDFYTGEAQVKVSVRNEKQMKNLSRWSYEKRTKNSPILWIGIPVSFHAASLHKCEECKKQTRQFHGHHKDWCFLARRESLQMVAKMTSTMKTTSTPHQTQIQAVESLEESQDEAQHLSQDESQDRSQDHNESQNESQEESQHESQDESQIEYEVDTLAEGSLMTAHANNNIKNETKNVMKQRYGLPEERCRQAAEKENDEEDTRRLSLSIFPPLSKICSLAFQICLFAFQFCLLAFIIAMVEDTS